MWKFGDENTINKYGPDGISKIIKVISNKAIKLQSGYIFDYAFIMLLGFSLLLTFFIYIDEFSNIIFHNIFAIDRCFFYFFNQRRKK